MNRHFYMAVCLVGKLGYEVCAAQYIRGVHTAKQYKANCSLSYAEYTDVFKLSKERYTYIGPG